MPPYRQIRARYSDRTITVYQAYSSAIADPALGAGTFVPPFKLDRMTWIKPSFLWMMYRSGWATKPGQERVLAVEITRAGFEWALAHASLSQKEPRTVGARQAREEPERGSPVRVQWDPERSLRLGRLEHRSIQIGLAGEAIRRYVRDWITGLTEVTELAWQAHRLLADGDEAGAQALLPVEEPYPLPSTLAERIGA